MDCELATVSERPDFHRLPRLSVPRPAGCRSGRINADLVQASLCQAVSDDRTRARDQPRARARFLIPPSDHHAFSETERSGRISRRRHSPHESWLEAEKDQQTKQRLLGSACAGKASPARWAGEGAFWCWSASGKAVRAADSHRSAHATAGQCVAVSSATCIAGRPTARPIGSVPTNSRCRAPDEAKPGHRRPRRLRSRCCTHPRSPRGRTQPLGCPGVRTPRRREQVARRAEVCAAGGRASVRSHCANMPIIRFQREIRSPPSSSPFPPSFTELVRTTSKSTSTNPLFAHPSPFFAIRCAPSFLLSGRVSLVASPFSAFRPLPFSVFHETTSLTLIYS